MTFVVTENCIKCKDTHCPDVPEQPSSQVDAPALNRTLTDASGNVAANELKLKHLEAALDEALTESFPASDPIAIDFSCAVVSNSS